jgi:sulfur-oxidizing protein SoxB
LVSTNLSSDATMTNNTGMFSGSPYITVTVGALAPAGSPGASASVSIQFTNPTNGFVTFTPVTYSGGL